MATTRQQLVSSLQSEMTSATKTMTPVRLIPRLDIKGPNLIKGIQLEGLRVIGDPSQYAQQYYQDGADELIYYDSVASLYERNSLFGIVEKTAAHIFVPLTVGGGIRSVDDVQKMLSIGADKISINTAAIKNKKLITDIAERFGSQCCVVEIQAKRASAGQWEAYIDNGREHSGFDAIRWAEEATALGAGEVLVTSIDQEGTGKNYDRDLLEAIAKRIDVPIIASGGAGSKQDIVKAAMINGIDACSFARIVHYGKTSVPEIREACVAAGINVRHI